MGTGQERNDRERILRIIEEESWPSMLLDSVRPRRGRLTMQITKRLPSLSTLKIPRCRTAVRSPCDLTS
ncbi:hypothetical protein KM043_015413 [Ampulex compressa]|nr:hypothetical protein KM043_015413 [Ampulex compressa]